MYKIELTAIIIYDQFYLLGLRYYPCDLSEIRKTDLRSLM